jgi:hypothetical protein
MTPTRSSQSSDLRQLISIGGSQRTDLGHFISARNHCQVLSAKLARARPSDLIDLSYMISFQLCEHRLWIPDMCLRQIFRYLSQDQVSGGTGKQNCLVAFASVIEISPHLRMSSRCQLVLKPFSFGHCMFPCPTDFP